MVSPCSCRVRAMVCRSASRSRVNTSMTVKRSETSLSTWISVGTDRAVAPRPGRSAHTPRQEVRRAHLAGQERLEVGPHAGQLHVVDRLTIGADRRAPHVEDVEGLAHALAGVDLRRRDVQPLSRQHGRHVGEQTGPVVGDHDQLRHLGRRPRAHRHVDGGPVAVARDARVHPDGVDGVREEIAVRHLARKRSSCGCPASPTNPTRASSRMACARRPTPPCPSPSSSAATAR